MSTRSAIARENPDGSVDVIYCHWDGYLTGVGLELVGWYSTKSKLDRLIELGNISTLEDTIEATKAQCKGTHFPAEHYDSLEELQESLVDSMIEYLYVGMPSTCQADVWLPDIEWMVDWKLYKKKTPKFGHEEYKTNTDVMLSTVDFVKRWKRANKKAKEN